MVHILPISLSIFDYPMLFDYLMLFVIITGSEEGCEGRRRSSKEEDLHEGGEPIVWEKAQAIWDRRSIATKERPHKVRQVAQKCPDSEEEDDLEAASQGSSSFEPILQNSR